MPRYNWNYMSVFLELMVGFTCEFIGLLGHIFFRVFRESWRRSFIPTHVRSPQNFLARNYEGVWKPVVSVSFAISHLDPPRGAKWMGVGVPLSYPLGFKHHLLEGAGRHIFSVKTRQVAKGLFGSNAVRKNFRSSSTDALSMTYHCVRGIDGWIRDTSNRKYRWTRWSETSNSHKGTRLQINGWETGSPKRWEVAYYISGI